MTIFHINYEPDKSKVLSGINERVSHGDLDKGRFRIGRAFITITNPLDVQQRILNAAAQGGGKYVCVSDPRTVDLAYKDSTYRRVMSNSLMNTPDAQPILWAARLWGLKDVQRTMGPVMFSDMIENPCNGMKHFLLGDTEETLKKIIQKASAANADIVGHYSPPFCNLDEYDYKGIARMINQSGADLVWIAMRAPKQDYFSVNIMPYLDKKVCIGVGAAFRFYIGEYKMAPPIIKKLGLMGLYWGRKGQSWPAFIYGYFSDNLPYMWHLAKIPFWRLTGRKYYE